MLIDKYIIAFYFPILAASLLHSFSELSSWTVAVVSLLLVAVLSLFSVVGKLVRNNPSERVGVALLVGLASGLLAVTSAYAIEVANPFIILSAAMGAAYKGPEYLKLKTSNKKQNEKEN